jgi:myo-inositol 2-dehydrogenase / D-chiro-inositol 1-dehydrogenase
MTIDTSTVDTPARAATSARVGGRSRPGCLARFMGSFHGETLARRLPGARLVAVADPAPDVTERLAAALGADRGYTDPAKALDDPAVDAVVIAAPARFHADLVVAAAGAGKAVFCEKPMALTLADADRAIVAARAAGVVLQVGFNRLRRAR